MSGTRLSRLVSIAAMAAGVIVSIATAAADFFHRCWTPVQALATDFGRWVMAKLPKQPHAGLTGGYSVRMAYQVKPPMAWGALRRPLVSPRWRMCPST